ncbi:MAG: LCP family protein [Clostridium sp.]|uniref:LCP family protein n=1 Tax=Clostridium sp. TaxID=1506 RepID=UPI0025C70CD0|nr:LCP family protein [Clostridium sp.]MCF0147534.1 LCP family protein [Clostridium sp.]
MGNIREDVGSREKRQLTREERIKRRKAIEAKKRKRRRKRILFSIITLMFIFIFAGVIYAYSFISGLKTNKLGNGIAPSSSKDSINILILGMDVGDTDNQANKSIRRSDTIMVFNYNPNTKKVHLVSVPRDTMIEVDAYLDTGEYQRYWKINSAYALGGEEEITTHVESLLDIDINYIVEVDYNAFRSVVDALGGVDMTIEQDMFYDDEEQDLHINFTAGETVHLDGKKAEEFFRWRQNNDGSGFVNGDLDRIKNQQLLMNKLLKKVLSPSIVFKAPNILKVISDNVDTNIPANKLISLGMKVIRLNSSDIIMTTLQGVPENIYGQEFLVSYKEDNMELINALNADNPSEVDSITSIKRDELDILVLNGTKINGLASTARDKLQSLGYVNIEVGNTTEVSKSTIQTDNKELKELLKSDTDINKSEKISISEYKKYDAVILLGEDYNLFN